MKLSKLAAQKSKDLWKQHRSDPESFYGPQVYKGLFGMKHFTFYQGGYVSVNKQAPEKLLGVQATINTQKKTLPGRAVVGVLTMFTNVMLSPNQRGDLYLSLITEVQTHSETVSPPMDSWVTRLQEIEGVAKSLIAAGDRNPAALGSPDIAIQLEKLSQLHADGALSDAECESAKAKVIGR